MNTIRKYHLLLLIIFLVLTLPLALFLVKQRQEIRKKAATNDITVYIPNNTLAPGASTTGAVNVTAGAAAVDTAEINLVYDVSKVTISNLACGSGLTQTYATITAGDLKIECTKAQGVSNSTFSAVTFTLVAGSSTGDVNISLGAITKIRSSGSIITGNKIAGVLHISSSTAGSPVFFSFGSSAVSPGGNTSGAVKLTAGTTLVKTARIVLSYDPAKITLSNLLCHSNFPTQVGLSMGSGTAEVTCTSASGVSNNTFDVATFNVQVASGAQTGSAAINFSSTSALATTSGADVAATFTNGVLQIGQSTTPTIVSLSPACGPRGTLVTATGTNLGATTGSVCFNGGLGCNTNANVSSWNSTQVTFTVPQPIQDSEYNKNFTVEVRMPGTGTAIPSAQTFYVSNNCGGSSPTPTLVVTPTPTSTLSGPASLTLVPASTYIASDPVLIEIKLNSGGASIAGAYAVINVDSKLSVVDTNGTTATSILAGDVPLPVKISLKNKVENNKVTYYASKDAGSPDVAVNGTLAKFYVKTALTSGTATLSFQTGTTEFDSYVQNSDSVNLLGTANPLTINLGSSGSTPTPTPISGPSFSVKLKLAGVDSQPTTPNVTGVDYGHITARVMLKTGDTVVLDKPGVILTPDSSGLYTSELIGLGNVAGGAYALYVKPEKHYQKRFPNTTVPTTTAIDLTTNSYRFGPGDLNQDGTINGVDIGIVINAINKQAGTALNASDLRADVDYNGIINGGDTSLIFETINTRFDEDH